MNKSNNSSIFPNIPRGEAERIIHLNNAGSSLPPDVVVNTIKDYLTWESHIGGYEAAALAKDQIAGVYDSLGRLVGAKSHEIAFVDSATRAWNAILYAFPLSPGDIILTSISEFGSNVVSLAQIAARSGVQVKVIKNDEYGRVSLSDLEQKLTDKVRLVVITHVPAQRGIVNPVVEIGEILRNYGVFYLVDACQSVGQMEVNVNQIGCDAMTATGRKWLRGPRGTGFFFLRENWIQQIEPATVDLAVADLAKPQFMLENTELIIREDIKRFEMWERSFALMLGLGAAADHAVGQGLSKIHDSVKGLAIMIRQEISRGHDFIVGEPINSECGIVTIASQKFDVSKIKAELFAKGINTSVVNDYDGPLDFYNRGIKTALRVSPHYYNTVQEVEKFLESFFRLV